MCGPSAAAPSSRSTRICICRTRPWPWLRPPERRDHLVGKEPQALALERGRDEPAGVRLEQDAVDAELVAELRQTLDQLGRRAERDFLREDVVVREIRHALGLKAPLLGGGGARASDRRARPLGLPGGEGR